MIDEFIRRWKDKGNERSDTQKFWLELLRYVLSLENPEEQIEFEKPVELSHISFIDAYIPSTRIIIEQKSRDVNLDAKVRQSDGTMASPFEQAKRYYDWLPVSQRGRYIIVCNFREIRVHDMEHPKAPPEIILLTNIARERGRLSFITDPNARPPKEIREADLSVKAGELVGKLYDSLIVRYINPDAKESRESLNVFCVRVVFLLYAEDAGLFRKSQFHDYMMGRQNMARDALRRLFEVLSQKPEDRDPYLEHDLEDFPYVNGGLFEEQKLELPQLDGEPLRIILEEMSEGFDWSGISPTIFGAVFESTLTAKIRHSGGMHYTSIENIHRVIDPLFMDELNQEMDTISSMPKSRARTQRLNRLHRRLSNMRFLDPACGSGNFLTESYISLRRLENRILSDKVQQKTLADSELEAGINVSISQFYGIECDGFAVAVAKTALWIAETQMWNETRRMNEAQRLLPFLGDLLPLKKYSHIVRGNALTMNWREVIPTDGEIFVMGNPPFLGYSVQSREQKDELRALFASKTAGKIDYVAGWYFKAFELMKDVKLKAAFVSTNSITQGEQVSYIFKTLYERFGFTIDFAHQAFVWDSEANEKAHVHVVVMGFASEGSRVKRLYTPEGMRQVANINFYLADAPNVFAEPASLALSPEAPVMTLGSMPRDGGGLSMTPEERDELLSHEPRAEHYIRRYMMGREFINGITRYCLWLVGVSPQELKNMPRVLERVRRVKEFRLESTREITRKLADTPHLFAEIRQPDSRYIAIPKVSSEKRSYIPMGWLDPSVIAGDKLFIIPDATLYHFGVLTSRIHMAWMRAVCGRLEMRYSYSNTVVYNTFAWPSPTPSQRSRIESTAQAVLDARGLYPESSFAALYDELTMPSELRRAHRENDDAVCEAYGWERGISEGDVVSRLFGMYESLREA